MKTIRLLIILTVLIPFAFSACATMDTGTKEKKAISSNVMDDLSPMQSRILDVY